MHFWLSNPLRFLVFLIFNDPFFSTIGIEPKIRKLWGGGGGGGNLSIGFIITDKN